MTSTDTHPRAELRLGGATPYGRRFEIVTTWQGTTEQSARLEWLPIGDIGPISITIRRYKGDLFHALTHGLPFRQFLNC